MFKIIILVCMATCGPAPIKGVEYFEELAACQTRAEAMAAEVTALFHTYGVPFAVGYKCAPAITS